MSPKFPNVSNLLFLLRYYDISHIEKFKDFVTLTSEKMIFGGIHDHLGGGFSRYSTDQKWLVPHFEKMLYDNGQLVSLYAEAYAVTNNPLFKEVVYQTIGFVQRELISPEGGFYSSLDADSEGLVLLTDDGRLQHDISHPLKKLAKTYLAQVEGTITQTALERLRAPLDLGDFTTLPCQAVQIEAPGWLWPRTPPIRHRSGIPANWLALTLTEGKNRQVRRMLETLGYPVHRLRRNCYAGLTTGRLQRGQFRELTRDEVARLRRLVGLGSRR